MTNVTKLENDVDRELRVISELWKILEPLKPDERGRVLMWLGAKCSSKRPFPTMPDDGFGTEMIGR